VKTSSSNRRKSRALGGGSSDATRMVRTSLGRRDVHGQTKRRPPLSRTRAAVSGEATIRTTCPRPHDSRPGCAACVEAQLGSPVLVNRLAESRVAPPNKLASTDATSTASLAVSTSRGEPKASSAMKSATVKPTPASAATPMTMRDVTSAGSRPTPDRLAIQMAPPMPSGFPTTSPRRTPRPIGLVTVSPNAVSLNSTPEFASAKVGATTRVVYGCRKVSTRSSGGTAPTRPDRSNTSVAA
jgi:hypothetical protein